jgi:tetratricopeptide (TPR) repeat protein
VKSACIFGLFLCVSLTVTQSAHAQSVDGLFRRAVVAHRAGRLEEAGQLYEQLVIARVDDADLWANLGLVYEATGRRGRAMVAFERSLAKEPGDEQVRRALAQLESSLARGRAERDGEVLIGARRGATETIARSISESVLAFGLLLFDVVLFSALLGLLRATREASRIALGVTAVVSLLLVLADGTLLLARRGAFREGTPAIVLVRRTDVLDAPDPRSPSAGHLEEGQRVEVIEGSSEFFRVEAPALGRGWVRRSDVATY